MLYWALFGLVVGVVAAKRRGFSLLGGAVGGALLGPLAFFLFFVSGVGSTRNVGGQVGRGILYALLLVVLAIAALVIYARVGGF
jgi:hypothetical protein